MNRRVGLIGEELAANYIRNKGYDVLERNYRTKLGELDIIAANQGIIIFIEVKTRTSSSYGRPSEAVNYKKQSTIQKLSQQYILYKN
ncbi:MAG TPA: YraN family protein, partial [Oscillospiraceae bacterium]|nr:YraN family protein [Oscillospiraceae bacterium]